jgi:hypothetical protein
MPGAVRGLFAAVLFTSALATVPAQASMSDVVAATYSAYSVTPPTPDEVIICHGFGCKYRAEIGLTGADRAKLTQLLAAGKASAEAERRAVAAAGAWFDRRIGPAAGTVNHVASAGMKYMYHPEQFDCVDASRNTTSLLLVLAQLKLLRHHTVDVPVSRGYLIDGRPPHTTAVLVDTASGEKWAVDSWTRGYGQLPEIMPLERWSAE